MRSTRDNTKKHRKSSKHKIEHIEKQSMTFETLQNCESEISSESEIPESIRKDLEKAIIDYNKEYPDTNQSNSNSTCTQKVHSKSKHFSYTLYNNSFTPEQKSLLKALNSDIVELSQFNLNDLSKNDISNLNMLHSSVLEMRTELQSGKISADEFAKNLEYILENEHIAFCFPSTAEHFHLMRMKKQEDIKFDGSKIEDNKCVI